MSFIEKAREIFHRVIPSDTEPVLTRIPPELLAELRGVNSVGQISVKVQKLDKKIVGLGQDLLTDQEAQDAIQYSYLKYWNRKESKRL